MNKKINLAREELKYFQQETCNHSVGNLDLAGLWLILKGACWSMEWFSLKKKKNPVMQARFILVGIFFVSKDFSISKSIGINITV